MAQCQRCKGAGSVWARSGALPHGFKIFCGASLNHSEDRQHVELVCLGCDGTGDPTIKRHEEFEPH
jgi:hypothetical protein